MFRQLFYHHVKDDLLIFSFFFCTFLNPFYNDIYLMNNNLFMSDLLLAQYVIQDTTFYFFSTINMSRTTFLFFLFFPFLNPFPICMTLRLKPTFYFPPFFTSYFHSSVYYKSTPFPIFYPFIIPTQHRALVIVLYLAPISFPVFLS